MKFNKMNNNNEQHKLSGKDLVIVALSVVLLVLLLLIVVMSRRRDKMIAETLQQNSEISTDDAIANINSSTLDYLEITEASSEKWLEIHNQGTEPIDISGLQVYVSGRLEASVQDGESIGKDGYYVVELGVNPGKSDENVVAISNIEGEPIKTALIPKLSSDRSYGVADSEMNVWGYMNPSKGKENNSADLQYLQKGGVFISAPGGFYNSSFELELGCAAGDTLYFTTDGSKPTKDSSVYEEPILINNKSGANYVYAMEATYSRLASNYMPGSVDAGMIVRAIAVNASGEITGEMSQAYFIGLTKDSDYMSLPVISIITDPENLFDYEHGIYIAGKQREDARIQGLKPEYYANFYNAWEKPAIVEYYEPTKDKSFEMNVNIHINDDQDIATRQKGFVISLDDKSYSEFEGSSITDFISDDGRIRLTTNYSDNDLKVRNLLADSLIEDTDIATTGCRPCVVFLDGEYWGLYALRPYYDSNYIQNRYGLKDQEIIFHTGNAYNQEFRSFYTYVTQTDLSVDANYEQVQTMMDVDNFIDYVCLNMYLGNSSFHPENGTAWRTVSKGGIGMADGRWRFISSDFSNTMYRTSDQTSTINSFLQPGVQGDLLFQSLLMNDEFCKKFESRMKDLVLYYLNAEKCNENLYRIIALTRKPAMASYKRFNGNLSDSGYSHEIDNISAFFEERGDYILRYTQELAEKGGDLEKAKEIVNLDKKQDVDESTTEENEEEIIEEEGTEGESPVEESDLSNTIDNSNEETNSEDHVDG